MSEQEMTETPKKSPKKKNPNWTPEEARKASKKAVWTKQKFADRRKEYKQAVMSKLTPDELASVMANAMKTGNDRKLNCCIEVAKFIGCHFDQSEERVQNLSVKSDSKVSGKLEVTVKGLDG